MQVFIVLILPSNSSAMLGQSGLRISPAPAFSAVTISIADCNLPAPSIMHLFCDKSHKSLTALKFTTVLKELYGIIEYIFPPKIMLSASGLTSLKLSLEKMQESADNI